VTTRKINEKIALHVKLTLTIHFMFRIEKDLDEHLVMVKLKGH